MSSVKPQGVIASEDVLNKKVCGETDADGPLPEQCDCEDWHWLQRWCGVVGPIFAPYVRRLTIGRAWPVWLGTGFGLGAGYTDCERSFNPVSVPGVRIVPADKAGVVPNASRFSQLQDRFGDLFGEAREKATHAAVDGTADLRTQAHERFAELSQSGKEAIDKSVSRLQDSTSALSDKIVETGKELFDELPTSKDATEKKVRVV